MTRQPVSYKFSLQSSVVYNGPFVIRLLFKHFIWDYQYPKFKKKICSFMETILFAPSVCIYIQRPTFLHPPPCPLYYTSLVVLVKIFWDQLSNLTRSLVYCGDHVMCATFFLCLPIILNLISSIQHHIKFQIVKASLKLISS